MVTKGKNQLKDIEIPSIKKDIGITQNIPDILIYDSLAHESGFVRNKPFRSVHFSLIFVLKGTLQLKVNLFEYSLKERNVIIIPPSAIREIRWSDRNVHFISLLFTSDFLQETGALGKYFNLANFLKESLLTSREITIEDHELILELIFIIYRLQKGENIQDTDTEIVRNIFKSILLKVKHYYNDIDQQKNLSGTIMYRFMSLLSQNYLVNREVSFYAQKLFVNEKYLTQLLKKRTGKTARKFIIDMVILEAKVLLDDRSLSIKQIAEKLRFENQFHFSRFFKQYAGMPPSKYRN
ncbi:helix-turn-helix domain-containing protein [Sinomicrobium sp. M5D2P17]